MSDDMNRTNALRAKEIKVVMSFAAALNVAQYIHYIGIATHVAYSEVGEKDLAKVIFRDELVNFQADLRWKAVESTVLGTCNVPQSLKDAFLADKRFEELYNEVALEEMLEAWKDYHEGIKEGFRS